MKKQIIFIMMTLTLTGYKLNAQHQHDHGAEKSQASKNANATALAFQKQLSAVFNASLDLNEALIASDAAKAKTAAATVQKTLALVDMRLLKGQAPMKNWMTYQQTLKNALTQMSGTNNLNEQRKSFAPFSEALYQSIKAFGLNGTAAYYQNCPMALNTGAYWLSSSKEIRNPYFGDKMLKCGSTKETLN